MNSIKYQVTLHKKNELYMELIEKVNSIKKEINLITNQMDKIILDKKIKLLLIKDQNERNEKYSFEINTSIKENIKIQITIEKIINILKVDNIENIIELYNKKKHTQESLNTQFQNLNNELNFLNKIFSQFEKKINIKENSKSEKNLNIKSTDIVQIDSPKLDSELQKLKIGNFIIIEKTRILEDFINKICSNIIRNEHKLNSVLLSINKNFSKRYNNLNNYQKTLINPKLDTLPSTLLNMEEYCNSSDAYSNIKNKKNSNTYSIEKLNSRKKFYKFFDYSVQKLINKKSSNYLNYFI